MALVSSLVPVAVAFSSCRSTLHQPTTTTKRYKHGVQALHGLHVSSISLQHMIRTSKSPKRRLGLQILMQKGAGFGKQPTEVKTKHKVLTLDASKAKAVETYGVFARKLSQGEPISRWESIGEILVNKGADVEIALKERRRKLLAAAKHQYPAFMVLKPGENLEYGFQKTADNTNGVKDSDDIVTVNVRGKEPDISIRAILRADDGTKVSSPKRF